MKLSEAAAVMNGALHGIDALFTGVAIDSREVERGDLFVALRGGRRDGHEFISSAGERGAAAALVSADAAKPADADRVAQIVVADTTAALGQLGAHWRGRFELPLVAVTGSNGKTTVSALLAAIFNRAGRCLAPRASFNNHWGVPLTLLRLRETHTHAVIEMGMNHSGEIAALSALARPGIALINNAARAHLAAFGDVRAIADAKAEIFGGLAPGGVAVLNADDSFYAYWRTGLARLGITRVVAFGTYPGTDVRTVGAGEGRIELAIGSQSVRVGWKLRGKHNVANAAAAAAVAHAAGIGIRDISAALAGFPGALPGRLCAFRGRAGARIIDDTYNANPESCKAALEALATHDGERIAVFGALAELGEQSGELHREVGEYARRVGVTHLLCLGAEGESDLNGYLRGYGGGERYDDIDALLARLEPLLDEHASVLVKGSRAAAMERVVAQLRPPAENSAETDAEAALC